MTLKELRASGHIIFETISGSKAYGLDTATSDTDIRGIFVLPKEQFYGLSYIGQVNDESNDVVYYELRKFMELLAKNNPNILELLHMPRECIVYKHPVFDLIKKEFFLSKLCKDTFANYAFTQIKKARGLNKKIVNPMAKERKNVLHFCYVKQDKIAVPLLEYLDHKGWKQKHCGLSKINHLKNCFNLFYNDGLNFNGIAKEGANEVCLSTIPKDLISEALLYFNMEGYSTYCKRYKEYWSWVAKRNDARYENNIAHGKNYDTKNMMHTFRLLHMAKEISQGKLLVKRADRDFLLAIKHGTYEYDDLVTKAEKLHDELAYLYQNSELMDSPDYNAINALLIQVRTAFYKETV